MKILLVIILSFFSALLTAYAGSSKVGEHEHLQIQNEFNTPEEVVQYYVARDASGFVWTGLLDAELAAFTLWSQSPQQDSFYIAKKYEIHPLVEKKTDKSHAFVEVIYELSAIGDAHGTRIPASEPKYRVEFELKKVNGRWKINKPDPAQLSPVILEQKFPFVSSPAQ